MYKNVYSAPAIEVICVNDIVATSPIELPIIPASVDLSDGVYI